MGKYNKTLKDAVTGGILIGIGCTAFLSCDNKALGAFLFSIGLCSICIFCSKLFTGALCTSEDWRELLVIYVGNLTGITLMMVIAKLSGIVSTVDISERVARTPIAIISRGVICEICIYIAVMGYRQYRRIGIIILGVMTFILCGSEHCIADMFYVLLSTEKSHIGLAFILLVTIGNIIGAAFMRWLNPYDVYDLTFEF